MFRDLRADEIECRVAKIDDYGNVTVLLYKDARCDQSILDETVGAMNWERHHCRENANCIVSIWDENKGQWVSKEDTGTESNTEKEKGLASDSFKRACFNWGIGRELYTAPTIKIKPDDCVALKKYGDKWKCFDDFKVEKIVIENKRITSLSIKNKKTNKTVFEMGNPVYSEPPNDTAKPAPVPVSAEPPATSQGIVPRCSNCRSEISVKVHDFSVKKYNRPLCMKCQSAVAST